MERQRKVKSRKKKQFPMKIAAAVTGMLVLTCAAAMGIYIKKGQSYQTIFFPNTIINGMDVSEKTVEEVKSLIASGIDGYTLTLKERGGHTETITKEEIALHSVFDGSLEKLLEAQDPMKWWSHRTEVSNYDIQTMIAYEEALLQQKMDSL
ncbi:MAG: hypothetical protein RR995_04220, partial [Hungatella sp.]